MTLEGPPLDAGGALYPLEDQTGTDVADQEVVGDRLPEYSTLEEWKLLFLCFVLLTGVAITIFMKKGNVKPKVIFILTPFTDAPSIIF